MGCFSFICKKSDVNVQENEGVYLFLLKDGKVIESMYGKYDLYGQVEGHKWQMNWNKVCELMFSHRSNGIAAIREKVYNGETPVERSKDDPNQGTGKRMKEELKNKPYHKVF